MEPARTIIKRLGGEKVVAAITATGSGAPYRWQHTREQRGTGGLIPQRYHRRLLKYAEENAIPLSADDFLPVEVECAAESAQ